jgi:2-octaprenyl-6-methoxyphenol hydroxylase
MAQTTDVLIIGGGPVGLALSLALAVHGLASIVIERADPQAQTAPAADQRVSAVASAPARMLRFLGLGDTLDAEGCPIEAIRVAEGDRAPALWFRAADAEPAEPLGLMLENRALRIALLAAVRAEPRIRLLAPAELDHLDRDSLGVRARLVDGCRIEAPLAVAADGRDSRLRSQAGIRTARWRYHAHALVGTFTHAHPHGGVAAELFYPDGPFAQLPMQDLPDGRHRSALVWTVPSARAPGLMALGPRGLAHEIRMRLGDGLGSLQLLGPVAGYPLGLHHAERYHALRLALIGDSAHVVHPIAGQGLNMGLRDVAALADVLVRADRTGLDIGTAEPLAEYERWRRADNAATAMATDGLTRLFAIPGRPATAVRRLGLGLVSSLMPLQRMFMAVARGEAGDLPPLLRGMAG